MYTKSVKWLTVGDVLAENIVNGGEIIVEEGTSLSIQSILKIQSLGILFVSIQDSPFLTKKMSNDDPFDSFPSNYVQQAFFEFIIQHNQNNRYSLFIDHDEDFLLLANLVSSISENDLVENLLSALRLWDVYSYEHVLDVFIIGTQWLQWLNNSLDVDGSIGFLLHDIGKIKVSRETLSKQDKLTEEEMIEIRRHPSDGAELLEKLGFSQIICEMVRYHHLRLNGTGYPDPFPSNLSVQVKILMIVDVFSALTLDRPYRKAYSFEEALAILQSDHDAFDIELLHSFIQFIQEKIN